MSKNQCSIADKIRHKLHGTILQMIASRWSNYRCLYPSYRHYLKTENVLCIEKTVDCSNHYISETPNSGAGIGHQLANWITGYWLAHQLGIKYAYSPFPSYEWDHFLGFGEGEVYTQDLLKNRKYRKVLLPPFSTNQPSDLKMISNIISSYSGEKVVFFTEQDTVYMEQFGVAEKISKKFFDSPARIEDQVIYNDNEFNIAVHIRRGDIHKNLGDIDDDSVERWLDNSYYYRVLRLLFHNITFPRVPVVYIFSQEEEKNLREFGEFKEYGKVKFCLDMSARDSFLHMVKADLLITSKSSFSYKPALISRGIRVCPKKFWHGYPKDAQWILVDDNGNITSEQIQQLKQQIMSQ